MSKSPVFPRPAIAAIALCVVGICNLCMFFDLPRYAILSLEVIAFVGLVFWFRWVRVREKFEKLLASDPASEIERWIDPITGKEMRERVITQYVVVDSNGRLLPGSTGSIRTKED